MTLFLDDRFGARALGAVFAVMIALSPTAVAEEERPLVLVELFTSEGCSSCPPADRLLAELHESQPVKGATVVPMSFHVDYWDRLGWKDPFGDAAYSRRQRAYSGLLQSDSVYTPQMIVNGTVGFVGSDGGAARNAITRAGKARLAAIDVTSAAVDGENLTLSLGIERVAAGDGILWAAVVEDDLESEVTRGENRGRRLKHQAVVRAFQGESYAPPALGDDTVSLSLPWDAAWTRANCRAVVAIQSKASGRIYALGQFALGSSE